MSQSAVQEIYRRRNERFCRRIGPGKALGKDVATTPGIAG